MEFHTFETLKFTNMIKEKSYKLTYTSCEPMPMSWIQGLLGALPLDPWLHLNISVGCATS